MYYIHVRPLNRPALWGADAKHLAVLAFNTRSDANNYLTAIGKHIPDWDRRGYKVAHVARKKMALWCRVARQCGARYIRWPKLRPNGQLVADVSMGLKDFERMAA